MNIDLSTSFTSIFSFIINVFRSVFSWLDGIYIFNGNVSLLDLNIAFAVFGIMFTALFAVVKNAVPFGLFNQQGVSDKARQNKERKQREENN